MHHADLPETRRIRGVDSINLVKNSLTGTQLKIRVMTVTKKELLKDFERALEFDQIQSL